MSGSDQLLLWYSWLFYNPWLLRPPKAFWSHKEVQSGYLLARSSQRLWGDTKIDSVLFDHFDLSLSSNSYFRLALSTQEENNSKKNGAKNRIKIERKHQERKFHRYCSQLKIQLFLIISNFSLTRFLKYSNSFLFFISIIPIWFNPSHYYWILLKIPILLP